MSSIVSFVGDRVSKKLVVLVGLSLALPLIALAQQGQDAVYNSTGQVTNSPAFIDASMFASSVQSPNLCSVLNWVLNPQNHILTSAGAVIDARGLPGTTPPTSMTCSISPWGSGSSYLNVPSTILLPATTGAAPIVIPSTWFLPPNTHLIGEGDSITPDGFTPGTTLLAANNFTSGTAMISFGSSSLCTSPPCTGISVENLTLNGQGQSIDGIDNGFAQDSSYVDHVSLYRIRDTGLAISGNANHSGPYTAAVALGCESTSVCRGNSVACPCN